MLRWRLVSAGVLAPITLGTLYLATQGTVWPLLLFVLGATGLCLGEFYRAVGATGRKPFVVVGFVFALLLVVDPVLPKPGLGLDAAMLWGVVASLTALTFSRTPRANAAADWALTVAGAAYVGGLMRYGLLLPTVSRGLSWSLVALLGTWTYDSAAYFAGKALGRRQLCPAVSPAKTWEGAVVGAAATALVALLFGPWLGVGAVAATGLGLLIAIAATVGDLAESRLKRLLGIKDMGRLIRGHGGLLDRVDSLLFVMPAVYWYAQLVGRMS